MSVPRILFVCTGNICRSPTAEAVLVHRAVRHGLEVQVDSAGTSAEETGNPPDRRARQVAASRGYTLPDRRARQVQPGDFDAFDLMLAATGRHLRALERLAPATAVARLGLLMDHALERSIRDIPDPWYGGIADYERALDLIEAGVDGLIRDLLAGR